MASTEARKRRDRRKRAKVRQQGNQHDRQGTMNFQQPNAAHEPVYHCQPIYQYQQVYNDQLIHQPVYNPQAIYHYQPALVPQYQYAPHYQYAPPYQYAPQYQCAPQYPYAYTQQPAHAEQPVYAQQTAHAQQPVYAQQPAYAQRPVHSQPSDQDRQSGKAQQPHDVAHAPSQPPVGLSQQTASGEIHASFRPASIHLERLQSLQDWLYREQNPFSLKNEASHAVKTEAAPTTKTEASSMVETEASPPIKPEASPTMKIEEVSPSSSWTDSPLMPSPVLQLTGSLTHYQSSAQVLSQAVQSTPIKDEPDLDHALSNPRKRSRPSSREPRPRKKVCPRS